MFILPRLSTNSAKATQPTSSSENPYTAFNTFARVASLATFAFSTTALLVGANPRVRALAAVGSLAGGLGIFRNLEMQVAYDQAHPKTPASEPPPPYIP